MTRLQTKSVRHFAAALVAAAPRHAAAAVLLTLLSSFTEGLGVLLLVPLLALVGIDAGGGALGGVSARLSAACAALGIAPTLPLVLALYVAVMATQSIVQRWQTLLDVQVQYEFVRALRDRVYRAMAGAHWSFLARNRSSDIVQILTQEVERVRWAAAHLTSLVTGTLLALVYVGIALRISVPVTAVVAACGGMLGLAVRSNFDRMRGIGRRLSESSKQFYAAISEHLASMKTAKSYGIADRHADIFGALSRDERDVHLQATRAVAALRQRLAIGVPLMLAIVMYVAYEAFRVPTASLLLLLFTFARLIPRLTGLYETAQAFSAMFPAFERVVEFETRCLAARENTIAAPAPIALCESIRFDAVTFDYRSDGSAVAVRDVTLNIAAGRTTAIVGASGSGKSTIVDLLIGLLTPTSGGILVDGRPLRAEQLQAWRDGIGYVPQDTFLFHDSVRANLRWARPDATEDEIWRALASAAAADFVAGLPEGLDTIVGDRGVLISGGERQRLALARALLRRPVLLVLDEATSSLDSENERRIQDAIDDLYQQVTIVVVTHRLSTVRGAAVIHVLDGGRVVESGSWDELTGREDGRLRELCRAQNIVLSPPASVLL